MKERIKKIYEMSKILMTNDSDTKRVEVIMLKFNETPEMINDSISRIVNHTKHPFKLTIFDNRLNSPNTSRIWNKLIRESVCDYVCIIDSDAYIPTDISPCWLSRMMESIDKTGIVVPVGNPDGVGGCNRATGAAKYPSEERATGIWSGYCFLIKKSVLEKTKMFNELFLAYGQDSEFAFRTMKNPGTIMRTDCYVTHKGGSSFMKAEKEGTFDREADKMYARTLYINLTKQN
jgi:hypothetical protein